MLELISTLKKTQKSTGGKWIVEHSPKILAHKEKTYLHHQLVFWAHSATKDYIRAKNNLQYVSYLLCTQVVKPQIIQKP